MKCAARFEKAGKVREQISINDNKTAGGFMKFFIDTANVEEIKKASALGMVDGGDDKSLACVKRGT